MSNKYRAVRTTIDGITFDSKREAARYLELRTLERAGLITNLQRPKPYQLTVNGVKIGRYKPDFTYVENGAEVVEDVKSPATKKARDYVLRKKLMLAIHGIEIRET
jgi:Protein of unknown function (DUF1064)